MEVFPPQSFNGDYSFPISIVGPLMKATTFINEAKSMEYAVEAANELLNLPVLPDSGKSYPYPAMILCWSM